jgi:predicted amidophosphoribosyltransferase
MNEIIGNLMPIAVINPPMRKVIDLTSSKREKAEKVAKDLGIWLGEQGFKVETDGKVVTSNGPPTEIQGRITSWFGHSEHEPTFDQEKVLTDYDETFDAGYTPSPDKNPKPMMPLTKYQETQNWIRDLFHSNGDVISKRQLTKHFKKFNSVWGEKNITKAWKQLRKAGWANIGTDGNWHWELPAGNPAFLFPKKKKDEARSAIEDSMAGQAAVKLSMLDPKKLYATNPADEKCNEKEVAVCCEAKENPVLDVVNPPAEHTDNRVKCDICGEMIDNIDEIGHHYIDVHGLCPACKKPLSGVISGGYQWGECDDCGFETEYEIYPSGGDNMPKENRHYTDEERSRIMRTPEFKKWIHKWQREKKGEPKQGWLHAFMSDVGHASGAMGVDEWPTTVRYSDRKGVERPVKRQHYLKVATKKRTIAGKPAIKEISMNPGGEEMSENNEEVLENPGHICPNDDTPLVSMGERCPKCGYERGSRNPHDKSWLMERRTKYRDATGADTTHRPAPHSREKFWVRGHQRGGGMLADGTHVSGHYRAANPVGISKRGTCDNCGDTTHDTTSLELCNDCLEGFNGLSDDIYKYTKNPGDDANLDIGSLALDNPPEPTLSLVEPTHKHAFEFVGLCNPVKGGKAKKLFKCVGCKKTFTE